MTQKTPSNITYEEIKEAFKELTLEDIRPIAISITEFLRDFGEFIKNVGTLQKKSEKASEILFGTSEEPEAFLALLVEKIPADRLKPLVQLSLRLSAAQTKLKRLKDSSIEEKLRLGEEFKQIAEKLAEILEEVGT